MFPKQPSVYREPASARPCRARTNGQRICRTPCKPHVSRVPFASETRTPFLALTCGRCRRVVSCPNGTHASRQFLSFLLRWRQPRPRNRSISKEEHQPRAPPLPQRPHRAAPVPQALAPRAAPHIAAPQMAAPRAAPHIAAPRAAPQMAAPRAAPHIAAPRHAPPQTGGPRTAQTPRAAPQQSARPSFAVPAQQQPQITGRNAGGQAGSRVAQPGPRGNLARQAPAAGPAAAAAAAAAAQSARIGRDGAPQQSVAPQQGAGQQAGRVAASPSARAAGDPRAFSGGVLRNQAFANLASTRDPSTRALANSTFQGRFFNPQWRRHFTHPIVIGWIGPLFWPYAYYDFIDYTF